MSFSHLHIVLLIVGLVNGAANKTSILGRITKIAKDGVSGVLNKSFKKADNLVDNLKNAYNATKNFSYDKLGQFGLQVTEALNTTKTFAMAVTDHAVDELKRAYNVTTVFIDEKVDKITGIFKDTYTKLMAFVYKVKVVGSLFGVLVLFCISYKITCCITRRTKTTFHYVYCKLKPSARRSGLEMLSLEDVCTNDSVTQV